jgi:hypothetical protein
MFDSNVDQSCFLIKRERRRLAASRINQQAVRALINLPLNQSSISIVINRAALEWYNKRSKCTFEESDLTNHSRRSVTRSAWDFLYTLG